MKKLEVIATNIKDVIEINKSKADRIELVYDLNNGGLTPTIETVKESVKATDIPIRVMVRPQYKSFVYSESTFGEILIYIKKLKALNENSPEGIVFGSLTEDGKINEEQLKKVIEVKGNLKLSFHRAFDEIKNYEESIDILNKYSEVETLLTSGTKPKAIDGIEELVKIQKKVKHLTVLVGSGVNVENIEEIKNKTGLNEFHIGTSARENTSLSGDILPIMINKIKEKLEF